MFSFLPSLNNEHNSPFALEAKTVSSEDSLCLSVQQGMITYIALHVNLILLIYDCQTKRTED